MIDGISINLIQNVIDAQRDMIIIFYDDEVILINKVFKNFVSVSSIEQYKSVFENFIDHFVPHPSYFNAEKIAPSKSWFDAVMKLDEIDRVVSLLNSNYEPHAFSIDINKDVQGYKIVTLTDVTQTLIKRIMTENKTNMDKDSGAYSKSYFLQISQSYEDAAIFNEKIIATVLIKIESSNLGNGNNILSDSVDKFRNITRQDDILIRWSDNAFLLFYLIDNPNNSHFMLNKLDSINLKNGIEGVKYTFTLTTQKENENVKALIKRIGS